MSTQSQSSEMDENSKTIALDDDGEVQLPVVELLTGRGFITGKSGSGKSNTASVVVEELLDQGFPVMIVDTDGEYWGLKEQYEILHVGADEECDLRVGPEHGEKLASLALEQNVPIILDVSGYIEEEEANELLYQTAKSLFAKEKKLRKPFLLLVEEVHEYIPQKGGGGAASEILIQIGKRGRKHGLGIAGMSQRPADVKKDFITQCDWMMWHRLTWDNDTKVVGRVLGSDYADAVEDLADGEAFLSTDFLEADVDRVQVRRKRTFDAGATPDLGDFERPDLKSVSGDLVDELEDISAAEERRQDRIAQLEAQVEELRDEKEALEDELDSARDMRDLAQQMAEGLQAGGGNGDVASEKVDELVDERNSLRTRLEKRENRIEELEASLEEAREELRQRPEIDERAMEAVEVLAEEFGVGDGDQQKLREKLKSARSRIDELESQNARPQTDALEHPSVQRYISRMKKKLSDLGEKEREMLLSYKYDGPQSVEDAYWAAGGSRKSSAKRKKNKTLTDMGLVEDGDSRGQYRYALADRVSEWFDENDHVGEDEVQAIVREIESEIEESQ